MDINPLKVSKVSECVYFRLVDGSTVIGTFYLPHETRFTETMNAHSDQKPFIPITGATIIEPTGKEEKSDFLMINRDQVVFCFPFEEEGSYTPEGGTL